MKKQIAGHSEYEIDTDGVVYRVDTGKIIKSRLSKKGYVYINIGIGERKTYRVHRLVAIAFIPNPDELETVDHIDEDKSNNSVSNLRWCTIEDNIKFYRETRPTAAKIIPKYKMSDIYLPVVVNGVSYESAGMAAGIIASAENKNKSTISKEIRRRHIKNGQKWIMYGKYNIGS